MDALGVVLLGAMLIGGFTVLWFRQRARSLELTQQRVRCPEHGVTADVTLRIAPDAPSCRRYVDVAACSLHSDAAVALPERIGHVSDPLYPVRLEPARPHPVHAPTVACSRPCVTALNEAACVNPARPLPAPSGVCDATELVRHTVDNPTISRLLWYGSL